MPKSSKDDPGLSGLDEIVRGIRKAAALRAALELEIFTRIAEGNRSLPALLRASGLNERGARFLLDALANINLLNKTQLEYTLTPAAEMFLVKGKSAYYGDALLVLLAWDARGQLARSVKSGKPLPGLQGDSGPRLAAARAAATWVDWQTAVLEFAPVWTTLLLDRENSLPPRALAFGAEAALRLTPLAQRDPAVRIMVVDTASALAPLPPILESLGLQDRVQFIDGDWLAVPLPADGFQLAFVDSITPYRSMEDNIGILHRALETLEMQGRIVLRAAMADDDRKGPRLVPLAGLDLLMTGPEADLYTATEYRGMLEAAGFFEVRPVGEQPGILTARRILPPPPPPPAPTVAPDFIPPVETFQ